MLHRRRYTARLALAVGALFALGACRGGDDNRASTDTAATTPASSGGDVNAGATAAMSPPQQLAFVAAVDQAEVEEGEVARTKATNAQVRQFAQRMVTEHSTHLRQTGQLQQQLGGNAQQEQPPGDLRDMHQQTMQRLDSLQRGQAFDTAYIDAQVMAHQTALQRLQSQLGASGTTASGTASGSDTGASSDRVQQHLQATERAVRQHLAMACQIQQRLGGGKGNTGNTGNANSANASSDTSGTSGTSCSSVSASGTSGSGTSRP